MTNEHLPCQPKGFGSNHETYCCIRHAEYMPDAEEPCQSFLKFLNKGPVVRVIPARENTAKGMLNAVPSDKVPLPDRQWPCKSRIPSEQAREPAPFSCFSYFLKRGLYFRPFSWRKIRISAIPLISSILTKSPQGRSMRHSDILSVTCRLPERTVLYDVDFVCRAG